MAYLAQLRTPKIILWCYLIWYVVMANFHFDARPLLWINSVGISVVIGTALVLSVLPPAGLRAMDKWALARLFMMPFCVSSFAALIKGQGFVVVFSPRLRENLIALGACMIFVLLTLMCRAARKI
jgi:asparagine N-glycosylation enzyme membrane subunit Stt3